MIACQGTLGHYLGCLAVWGGVSQRVQDPIIRSPVKGSIGDMGSRV